jgi:undecaprenyl diphosphate synthase
MNIGIIMDGNGRWAMNRGRARSFGHMKGAARVSEIVKCCPELGVKSLTLYAFSTENWKRAAHEVESLMRIFRGYLQSKFVSLVDNNVRVRFIGDHTPIAEDITLQMKNLECATQKNDGLLLNIAMNYGGRDEIVRAIKKVLRAQKSKELTEEELTENMFASFLDTAEIPDPDLIIRTAGELRLSNFLSWQSSYSELYFTDLAWPDFSKKDFVVAINSFALRQRKFGKTRPSLIVGK